MKDKLLVVDDEEGIRKVLKITLSDLGYQVATAASGEEAFKYFKKNNPSIILTDIKMPGMNGIELLGKIKEDQLKDYADRKGIVLEEARKWLAPNLVDNG